MFGVLLGLMLTFLPVCLIALGQKVYILYGIVWAADTSALLAGKFFGGSKLLMSISPQKTVSGFCGAIFGGGVVGWALGGGLEVSLALAAISQVGDLAESAIKRCADLKDSDVWFRIPGHGGFLDRIDALILAAPFAYIIIK
jgi:phosphatidate cytidylyltransferase